MADIEESYRILGLRLGASEPEIKQAYRDMVKVWHPDRFSSDPRLQNKAQEKLKEINWAYEVLLSTPINPKKKSSGDYQTENPQPNPKRDGKAQDQQYSETHALKRSKILFPLLTISLVIGISIYWFYQQYSGPSNDGHIRQQSSNQNSPLSANNSSPQSSPHSFVVDNKVVESMAESFITKTARNLGGSENKEVRKICYGDLDGDGDQDVAINYAIEGVNGGNNSHTQLAAFRNDGGQLSFVDKVVFADYERVALLVSISNGQILCNTFTWSDQDPHCCPSIKKPSAFILSQNRLRETGLK